MFRIDRITELDETGEVFRPEKGRTLTDFYRQAEQRGSSSGRTPQQRPERDEADDVQGQEGQAQRDLQARRVRAVAPGFAPALGAQCARRQPREPGHDR